MPVEPHQLEKGIITAHSGHWKQENTFLAKLWRYILGGLETQKFWISSFQRHAASGGFYNQSDAEKCNWQLQTCMKNVTPRILGRNSPTTLSAGSHSFMCLNFEPWCGNVCVHFLWAAPQKPVWPAVVPTPLILFCAMYVTFISSPTWGGRVLVFPLGHKYQDGSLFKTVLLMMWCRP